MLNVKYIIENDPENPIGVTRNPNNFGNAWFIEKIKNGELPENNCLGNYSESVMSTPTKKKSFYKRILLW